MQGHIYKGCDIMERLGVVTATVAVMEKNIVNMFLYTMDMMSTYIEDEIS